MRRPAEEKPLEMPEDAGKPKDQEKKGYSLTEDYPAEDETGAARIPGNVNTNPVKIDAPPTYVGGGGFIPGGETTVPFYEAQSLVNRYRGIGGKTYEDFVDKLRAYTGSELGTAAGVDEAWNMVLRDAYSSNSNAMDLLNRVPNVVSGDDDLSDFGFNYSGYTGPKSTVTVTGERDLRMAADAIASTILGRAITNNEFQKVLKQVRAAERAEPTVTTTAGGMTTTQSGLTAEGRQNIIRDALMQGPEAEDFGKATKMMDLFYSALEARPEGA